MCLHRLRFFSNYGLSQEVGLNFLGRAVCQSYQRSQILFQRMCPYPYFLSRRLHHRQMRGAVYTQSLCGGCVSHRRLCVPPASPITCLVPLSNTCAPSPHPALPGRTGCFPLSVLGEGFPNYLPLLNTPAPILLPYLHNLPAQLPCLPWAIFRSWVRATMEPSPRSRGASSSLTSTPSSTSTRTGCSPTRTSSGPRTESARYQGGR